MGISIYYTEFKNKIPSKRFESLLNCLPKGIKKKTMRYFHWQDAHASLLGKHLLLHGLSQLGISTNLELLKYTAFNRPYLNQLSIDFNIAHSDNIVVCAISSGIKIGIDLEVIKTLDFSIFRNQFTLSEWEDINKSINPLNSFYQYWTIKEAVSKGDGRGISQIPFIQILSKKRAKLDNSIWHIKKIRLSKKYVCHVATETLQDKFIINKINFKNQNIPLDITLLK